MLALVKRQARRGALLCCFPAPRLNIVCRVVYILNGCFSRTPMPLTCHWSSPLPSEQISGAGAMNASSRFHGGVTNEHDWRWCVKALRAQGLSPDYDRFDLQLCGQLYDIVSKLGLAEEANLFRIVTVWQVGVEYRVAVIQEYDIFVLPQRFFAYCTCRIRRCPVRNVMHPRVLSGNSKFRVKHVPFPGTTWPPINGRAACTSAFNTSRTSSTKRLSCPGFAWTPSDCRGP